jgi:hypothetical protein
MPWIGYFSMIRASNVFVFLDDVQYDKNGWRNRNRIKGSNGPIWLTVPVLTRKRSGQKISDVEIDYSTKWVETVLGKIRESYRSAEFFSDIYPFILETLKLEHKYLNDLNLDLLTTFMKVLQLNSNVVVSSTLKVSEDKIGRLIDFAEVTQSTQYISGPIARDYIDENKFREHGLSLKWYSYDESLKYPQLNGDFLPKMSIVDLLMNLGPEEATRFIDRINESWEQLCKE